MVAKETTQEVTKPPVWSGTLEVPAAKGRSTHWEVYIVGLMALHVCIIPKDTAFPKVATTSSYYREGLAGPKDKTFPKSFKDTKIYLYEQSTPSKQATSNKRKVPFAISSRIVETSIVAISNRTSGPIKTTIIVDETKEVGSELVQNQTCPWDL